MAREEVKTSANVNIIEKQSSQRNNQNSGSKNNQKKKKNQHQIKKKKKKSESKRLKIISIWLGGGIFSRVEVKGFHF